MQLYILHCGFAQTLHNYIDRYREADHKLGNNTNLTIKFEINVTDFIKFLTEKLVRGI